MEETMSTSTTSGSSTPYESEMDELECLETAPSFWKNSKKMLSKQLSLSETQRDLTWERRRHQKLIQEHSELCDEDLNDLKGCIELGFGFNEEKGGQSLTNTLPALDLYFSINRLGSPMTSPSSATSSGSNFSAFGSSSSNSLERSSSSVSSTDQDSPRIYNPGEDPQQVKTKLRHWAQAVACSVMQAS